MYVVYDVLVLNGTRIHDELSFADRQAKITELLELFHFPDLVALVPIANAPVGTHVRGYEQYDIVPGTIGVYLPSVE
jgi:hypothetical protein